MSEILDRLGVGVAVRDHETRVLAANRRFASLLRRQPADLIGLRMQDITHPDDVALADQLIRMARKTSAPVTLRKRYVRPSGQNIWVENRIFFLDARHEGEPTSLLLSRRIAKPSVDVPSGRPNPMIDYVAELSRDLATIARKAGLAATEELLLVASQLAREQAA